MREFFRRVARSVASALGSPFAFGLALFVVVIWAALGPVFGFSNTWQLVINTGTTIVTFLVVFLIQNTQNRDTKALHLKLDELIRAVDAARNGLIDSEDLTEDELNRLEAEFAALRNRAEKVGASPVRVELRHPPGRAARRRN
jgi:low affinity Fe/Cu permease